MFIKTLGFDLGWWMNAQAPAPAPAIRQMLFIGVWYSAQKEVVLLVLLQSSLPMKTTSYRKRL